MTLTHYLGRNSVPLRLRVFSPNATGSETHGACAFHDDVPRVPSVSCRVGQLALSWIMPLRYSGTENERG